MVTLLIILMAYVIGAIPIAYLAGRLAGHNLLNEGSGGVSGSAAIERLGLVRGSCAGFCDALKPVAVVLITQRISVYDVSAIASVAAVVGHIWPITLRFRGGRGVGPAGGALAALGAWPIVIALAGLLLGRAIFKDSAPGVIVGFVGTAILVSLTGQSSTLIFTSWLLLVVLGMGRLIGFRKSSVTTGRSIGGVILRRLLFDRD